MAKLKDLQFSMNGEQKTQAEIDGISNYLPPTNPTAQEDEYVLFKLVDNTKQGGVYIDGIADVPNPNNGNKVERIRLISGVDDIWMKNQKHLDKEYINQNRRSLHFPRGAKILRIHKNDPALEFARLCPHNVGSPNKKTGSKTEFYEYNPAKQQEDALRIEMLEIDAAIKATEQPVEYMRKHANYLGVIAFDEYGLPKNDAGIRREYILKAKRNPELFMKSLNSKVVEIAFMVKKAILDGKIDLGGHSGSVTWSNGGGFITFVPKGKNTQDYLVDLALTSSDEGKRFLSILQENAN